MINAKAPACRTGRQKEQKRKTVKTASAQETIELGKKIGKILNPKDILVLIGPLGAGKTTLIQGIAQGLEVKDYITSPTFIIINEYKGELPFYHIDLYRLEELKDIQDLGVEEYFKKDGVCVVEWGEKLRGLLPQDALKIEIKIVSENERLISLPSRINL